VALRFCTECGKEVSDRALACPHCGHPVEDAIVPQKVEPPVVVVKKNSHPVLTFIGIAAIVLVVLLGVAILIVVNHKEAKLVATDGASDDTCTQWNDYCLNVYCTFTNVGKAGGQQRVHAQLLDTASGKLMVDHFEDLTLAPQESQRLKFSFPEAELDWHVSYLCKVDPKGSSQ
jgi:hypothetical protein